MGKFIKCIYLDLTNLSKAKSIAINKTWNEKPSNFLVPGSIVLLCPLCKSASDSPVDWDLSGDGGGLLPGFCYLYNEYSVSVFKQMRMWRKRDF